MKVISFEEKKRQKEDHKRYEYIKSMCQFQRPDLFDKLIAEQELTEEKIASCSDFTTALEKRGIDPLAVIEEATFVTEEEFYEDWGINWWIAVEEALVYYAFARKVNSSVYEKLLRSNPFVSSN